MADRRNQGEGGIDKLRPMLETGAGDIASRLLDRRRGIHLVREKELLAIKTNQSLIATAQVAEDRIVV